jgi:hypothetical protein
MTAAWNVEDLFTSQSRHLQGQSQILVFSDCKHAEFFAPSERHPIAENYEKRLVKRRLSSLETEAIKALMWTGEI